MPLPGVRTRFSSLEAIAMMWENETVPGTVGCRSVVSEQVDVQQRPMDVIGGVTCSGERLLRKSLTNLKITGG